MIAHAKGFLMALPDKKTLLGLDRKSLQSKQCFSPLEYPFGIMFS